MKKWITRMLVAAIAFVILIPSVARAESVSFSDTKNHWAKTQIEQAVQKGYVNGFPNGTFKPDAPVTRAQFIKMVVKALDMEHAPEGSMWYTTYVKAAKVAAIYQGDADFAEWNMNKEISREHMAWLAARAADDTLLTADSSGITKDATTDHWPLNANDNKITRTDEEVMEYYHGFLMSEAFKKGILQGFGGNEIGLERTTTRAQAVTVIERVLDLRAGKKLTADKYAVAASELIWLKTNLFVVAPHIFDDQGEVTSDLGLGVTITSQNSMKNRWMKENLVIKDSNFHAEINQIVLVNLGDPKDPNRKLLPNAKNMGVSFSEMDSVPKDAFIAIVEYEVFENKMPNVYSGVLFMSFTGYVDNDSSTLPRGRKLFTDSSKFNYLNNSMYDGSLKPTGKHTMAYIIPNSKYTLEKRLDRRGNPINDTLGRQLIISLKPTMAPGAYGETSSKILSGMTTHYDK